MGIGELLGIIFGSIAAEVLIITTIISYCANHFEDWGRDNGDTEFGTVVMAIFWPLTIIPLIIWALTVTPHDYDRYRAFLYPVFTIAFWKQFFPQPRRSVPIDPARSQQLMEWAQENTRGD